MFTHTNGELPERSAAAQLTAAPVSNHSDTAYPVESDNPFIDIILSPICHKHHSLLLMIQYAVCVCNTSVIYMVIK